MVSENIWVLMMAVWFLERHHAMHAQIYSTTNHIPFYIPICLSGMVNIVLAILLSQRYGIAGFPIAHLVSNAIINNWWNVKISLRSINVNFARFFYRYLAAPFALIVLLGLALKSGLFSQAVIR
jgi:hypothetical protein